MARGDLPALAELTVADPPEVWRGLGFAVDDAGSCTIGGVRLIAAGAHDGEGLTAWTLRADRDLPPALDGIPTRTVAAESVIDDGPAHPNGALALDHVVVSTPDLPRTLAALTAAGLEVRRVREASPDLHQAFLWAGDVLVEVAGPPAALGTGPASLWGLVVVAPDLDPFARLPGGCSGTPGRRFSPVAGSSRRPPAPEPARGSRC